MRNVGESVAADDAFGQRYHDLPVLEERSDANTFIRSAIPVGDDNVLCDVNKSSREVSRFRGSERRVGKTLSCAVRGQEVLEHVQTLAEVGRYRIVNDASRRIGHQSANTGHLAHLAFAAARAGIHHHANRIIRLHILENFVRYRP